MVKLRKSCAYRRLERPYTRVSKYRNKSFVRAKPPSKIVRFNMGETNKEFEFTVKLLSKTDIHLRHNCIESARQIANRILETSAGKGNFFFQVMVYPHHILRENPLASGAGADRMSTGMQKAFGKPISRAARVRSGQTILRVCCDKPFIKVARQALRGAYTKIPCSCSIQLEEKAVEKTAE